MSDSALEQTDPADKRMKLRYAGTCRLCGAHLPARAEAIYERSTKTVRCVECPTTDVVAPEVLDTDDEGASASEAEIDAGAAGSSARREYERRKAKDEERLRQKWGRFGGLAVTLSEEKQSTKAWATGAVGEELLGARLDGLVSENIAVLHDRRIPGSRANIDHVVVTRGGVWVIDAKRYKGRPELRIEGGIMRPRVEKVFVGRRDCTALVDGVLGQAHVVREQVGDIPVTSVLCFIDADWPLIGGTFTTRGVHVVWPKRLTKMLQEADEDVINVADTVALLATRLKPA